MVTVSIIFIPIGLVFTVIGILFVFFERRKALRCSEKAEGTIVDIEELHTGNVDGGTTSTTRPIIQYRANGKTIKSGPKLYTNTRKMKIGDSVTVFYDPAKPEFVRIKGYAFAYIFGAVFLLVGLTILIIGLF